MDENDQKSHPSSTSPEKESTGTASDESAKEAYGIEVVSSDVTKLRLPESTTQEPKSTTVKEELKSACFKTKSRIKINIPFPSFHLSTKGCCTITFIVGVILLVTACAGIGIYFLSHKRKDSDDKISTVHHHDENKHQIQVSNLRESCLSNFAVNLSESEKRCVFVDLNYHKECQTIKCYQVKYTFAAVQNNSEIFDTFTMEPPGEISLTNLQAPPFTYCDPGKWCYPRGAFSNSGSQCEYNYHDKTTNVKELQPAEWVDSCGVLYECMTIADDSLSKRLFEIIVRSFMNCNETRRSECKEGFIEYVPEV